MTSDLANFSARLQQQFFPTVPVRCSTEARSAASSSRFAHFNDSRFNSLALELFRLQFARNVPYAKLCQSRGTTPGTVQHWSEIPCIPTAAFKDLEFSCLAPAQRTAVFHSSGTTAERRSRHFHNQDSLALYEASLWAAFNQHVVPDWQSGPVDNAALRSRGIHSTLIRQEPAEQGSALPAPDRERLRWAFLTPPPAAAPHSSLVYMFHAIRKNVGAPESVFFGAASEDGGWDLDLQRLIPVLERSTTPMVILGTAFSFVHLLDFLAQRRQKLALPPGSRVMETGGYKNRSRAIPKPELHSMITDFLGIARTEILCEYGMSELSSQAYDRRFSHEEPHPGHRRFQFPAWARVQIVSPETGREVADGETGLVRVFDLANTFSVMAIQTEDLGIRRGTGFELLGRAPAAEMRGCSLMCAESIAAS